MPVVKPAIAETVVVAPPWGVEFRGRFALERKLDRYQVAPSEVMCVLEAAVARIVTRASMRWRSSREQSD